jgi:hypothetical protein
MADATSGGGRVYFEWIQTLAAAQDLRKEKLEGRGLAVISVSGTLVTLLFGLATLATKTRTTYTLPATARDWLYVALALLSISAILAILTNIPIAYRDVAPLGLRALVSDDYWADTESDAQQRLAVTLVTVVLWNRKMNTAKAFVLMAAIIVQIAAVVSVAIAIYKVLYAAPVVH